jgi:hypothetical protein
MYDQIIALLELGKQNNAFVTFNDLLAIIDIIHSKTDGEGGGLVENDEDEQTEEDFEKQPIPHNGVWM